MHGKNAPVLPLETLDRFAKACQRAASRTYAMQQALPDPLIDDAGKLVPLPALYDSIDRVRNHDVDEIRELAPTVLAAFRDFGQDASAVYHFMMRLNIIQNRTPDDSIPIEAALWNLRLHAKREGAPPIPWDLSSTAYKAAEFITQNPGTRGPEVAKSIHTSSSNFRSHIILELKAKGFHTKPGKQGYYPPPSQKL